MSDFTEFTLHRQGDELTALKNYPPVSSLAEAAAFAAAAKKAVDSAFKKGTVRNDTQPILESLAGQYIACKRRRNTQREDAQSAQLLAACFHRTAEALAAPRESQGLAVCDETAVAAALTTINGGQDDAVFWREQDGPPSSTYPWLHGARPFIF